MRINLSRFRSLAAAIVLAVVAAGNSASANNIYTGPSGGDWGTDANWSLGYAPDAGLSDLHTSVNINGEVFVTDAQDGTSANGVLCVGDAAAGGTTITLNNVNSYLTVVNGTLFGTAQQGANGPATLNLSAGTWDQTGNFEFGHQYSATVNQTGGQMLISNTLRYNVAAAGATSTYDLYGGVLTTANIVSTAGATGILDFGGMGTLQIGNDANGGPWDYADLTGIANLTVQVEGSAVHTAADFTFTQVTVGVDDYTEISLATDAPSVTITNPASDSVTVDNSVTSTNISGTGVNLAGDVSWTNDLTGASGTATAGATWTISGIALSVGANDITVTGTNTSGTATNDSVTITRQAAGAPTVSITDPSGNVTVDNSVTSTNISGTGVNLAGDVSWTNDLTGASGTATAGATWAINGVTLAVGANDITVSGTNATGTATNDSVTITRQAPVGLSITDGSFENVAGPVGPIGLQNLADWTQESTFETSGVNIQDASMPSGEATDGARVLRLASDNPGTPAYVGAVYQNLGTFVAGDTYTFSGDYFREAGSEPFQFGVELRKGSATGTILASYSDTLNAVGSGAFSGTDLRYTAFAGDDGQDAYLRIFTVASSTASGDVRGGADNIQLVTAPPRGTLFSFR